MTIFGGPGTASPALGPEGSTTRIGRSNAVSKIVQMEIHLPCCVPEHTWTLLQAL